MMMLMLIWIPGMCWWVVVSGGWWLTESCQQTQARNTNSFFKRIPAKHLAVRNLPHRAGEPVVSSWLKMQLPYPAHPVLPSAPVVFLYQDTQPRTAPRGVDCVVPSFQTTCRGLPRLARVVVVAAAAVGCLYSSVAFLDSSESRK